MRTTPIILALALAAAPGCARTPATSSSETGAGLPDRDPSLARKLVQQEGALLLDVRSQGEFDGGHLEGAVLIPHDELQRRIAEVETAQGGDRSKPIVVYCRSGRRSGLAKDVLLEAGFEKVTNLGGMSEWCDDC